MTPDPRIEISRQVARVRRRLFATDLIRRMTLASAGALVCTIAWMLLEPFAFPSAAAWWRWAILGGACALGVFLAIGLAIHRRMDSTSASLGLDSEFGLRERVVTSLALTNEEAATPAGQALMADTLACVKNLRVSDRFPIRVGSESWLLPIGAGALALVALFYDPIMPVAQGTTEESKLSAEQKESLEKKLQAIARPKREPIEGTIKQKSEELKRLEAKLDELARKPRDTTQQLRERVKDITPLEDQIKKLERDRTERARMLQQQLQLKDGLAPNDSPKDGPAQEFQKALSEGDMDKAREELSKLAKKMEAGELSEKEKEKLGQQLNGLQKKLQELAQQKNKEDMLKKLAEEGKLDAEALERELSQLRKDNEKLKDLQKLANKLNQCQQCMKTGDMASAQKALAESMQQLESMAGEKDELNELREQLNKLKQTKDAITSACEGDMPGGLQEMGEGQNPALGQGMPNGQNGQGQDAAQGAGERPDGEQGKIRTYDAKQNGQFNAKGQKVFDGFVPGQAFKKKSGVELAGEIRQAAQDAPEAIETQRIPKAARDMARGYFKNLGGQAEGEKAPKKKE